MTACDNYARDCILCDELDHKSKRIKELEATLCSEMMASAEHIAGPWERVRIFYHVPARRGGRVIFSGYGDGDIHGRLTYCNGQYVWMRADDGRKIGPLHPTWELLYVA